MLFWLPFYLRAVAAEGDADLTHIVFPLNSLYLF